jgi:iron(III) transport system permease protein
MRDDSAYAGVLNHARAALSAASYGGLWLAVLLLVAAPIALLAVASFKGTPDALPLEPGPFTFANYKRAFGDPQTIEVILNTFVLGLSSVAIALTIAVAMAWITERTNAPLRGLIYVCMILPIGIPGMLLAIAWVFLFNPQNGIINLVLKDLFGFEGLGPINIYNLAGICVLQGISMVSSSFLMMSGAFRQMDPTLEDAALACGATWRQIAFHITLPLMLPAILAAAIYFFVFAIEAFEIPGIIGLSGGISVLSSRIYWATHPGGGLPEYGYVAALGTPLVFASICLMYFYNRVTRSSERFTTVTPRGYRPHLIDLGRMRWLPTIMALLYLTVTIVLPLAVLFWGTLFPYWSNPSVSAIPNASFDAYWGTINYPGVTRALFNTALVTIVAATVTMLLAGMLSWISIRTRWQGRRLLDVLAFLPHSIPGIVIGLALIFTYLTVPIPVYGTVWIIVIACITRFLAYASRTMNAAQIQISKELEEAATTSGASIPRVLGTIVLPLLAISFRNGWLWVAMHAARELSASVMLYSPGSIVLSTILWSMWQNGKLPEACVLGVVLVVITMTLGAVGGLFGQRQTAG